MRQTAKEAAKEAAKKTAEKRAAEVEFTTSWFRAARY
jgi:hypothetical protein